MEAELGECGALRNARCAVVAQVVKEPTANAVTCWAYGLILGVMKEDPWTTQKTYSVFLL